MSVGMGAFNLNERKRTQLNSSLKSAEARSAVVTTASKARSSATLTRIVTSRGLSSGSVFFTPSMRRPKITSFSAAVGLSRALNNGRPNYRYVANLATTGIATQNATYNVGPSKAASFGEALGALAGLITAGAGAAKTLGLGSKLDKAVGDLGGSVPSSGSNEVASYISNMQNCTSASSLSSNIANAKDRLTEIQSNSQSLYNLSKEYESKKEEYKADVDTTQATVKEKEKGVDAAKKDYDSAQSNVGAAKDYESKCDAAVTNKTQAYKDASTAYTKAQQETKTAEANVQTCETGVASAEADLAAAQTTLGPDGKPDLDAISKAEAKLEKAKNDLTEARTKRDEAKKAEAKALSDKEAAAKGLSDATAEEKKAKEDVLKAINQVKNQQKNLDTCTKTLDSAKDELSTAKEAYDKANAEIENGKAQISMLTEAQDNYDKLSKAIEQQTKRLAKMEKSEDKAEKKALTKADKQAASSGTQNLREENTDSYAYNKAVSSSDDVGSYGNASWTTSTSKTTGHKLREITVGSTKYYVDKNNGEKLTQAEFNQQISGDYNTVRSPGNPNQDFA